MQTEVASWQPACSRARRWPRYKVDVPILVSIQSAANNLTVRGQGTELNWGGLTVFTSLDLHVGDEVTIGFKTPYSGRLNKVQCIVRSRGEHAYGVEFMENG